MVYSLAALILQGLAAKAVGLSKSCEDLAHLPRWRNW
jgi:hypothetical protein